MSLDVLFELDYEKALRELIKIVNRGICGKCGTSLRVVSLNLNLENTRLYVSLYCKTCKSPIYLYISNYQTKIIKGELDFW